MIGYVTLGTNNIAKAKTFYEALLAPLGAKILMQFDNGFTMYGTDFAKPALAITPPHDGKPATVGNGVMPAIVVDTRAKVDELHTIALAQGGTCEGPPGLRGEEGDQAFYGAYFRDLDGNKLGTFHIGPAQ